LKPPPASSQGASAISSSLKIPTQHSILQSGTIHASRSVVHTSIHEQKREGNWVTLFGVCTLINLWTGARTRRRSSRLTPGGLSPLVHRPQNPLDPLQQDSHKSLFDPISKRPVSPPSRKRLTRCLALEARPETMVQYHGPLPSPHRRQSDRGAGGARNLLLPQTGLQLPL